MSDTAYIPNEQSGLSLLSLSAVAASAAPIPLSPPSGPTTEVTLGAPSNGSTPAVGLSKHRRLSSSGKAKRRLSDARDAANRPSANTLQTAANALATLSLSSSPPTHAQTHHSTSFTSAASAIPIPSRTVHDSNSKSMPLDDGSNFPSSSPNHEHDSGLTKGGKKRGTIFTCESCSKVYRHPSCLIKHRWEHSPQWREASKFVLSKHQQVQLLEAAAILSHLSPDSSGTSLPEDRSLWPSFLSGGALPPPTTANPEYPSAHPTSSSVPATSLLSAARAPSSGPRMHDYSIPSATTGAAGLTQLRPGVIGVPTGGSESPTTNAGSLPVPVPNSDAYRNQTGYGSIGGKSEPWGSPASSHYAHHSYQSPPPISFSKSYSHSDGTGGWSLPRSSVRSMSRSSRSRSPSASASGSKSDDDNELVDVVEDINGSDMFASAGRYSAYGARGRIGGAGKYGWRRDDDDMSIGFSVREEDEEEEDVKGGKETEEEWDGMEMDMVMD